MGKNSDYPPTPEQQLKAVSGVKESNLVDEVAIRLLENWLCPTSFRDKFGVNKKVCQSCQERIDKAASQILELVKTKLLEEQGLYFKGDPNKARQTGFNVTPVEAIPAATIKSLLEGK